jgi:hypothetical protein
MFDSIATAFDGEGRSTSLHTDAPEGALTDILEELGDRFDVTVGVYPGERSEPNRVTIRGTERRNVEHARQWLADRIDLVEE